MNLSFVHRTILETNGSEALPLSPITFCRPQQLHREVELRVDFKFAKVTA